MMELQYRTPFIDSTIEMFSTMIGASCGLCDRTNLPLTDIISGTVIFHGDSNGQITLTFPIDTARKIVAEMLGMDESEMDEETLKDGVGEMANIVAGNVKAALASTPYRLLLSLPKIQLGPEELPAGVDKNQDQMESDYGAFYLIYWLTVPS